MSHYVLNLADIDCTRIAETGGKGAQLGELTRIPEITIPDGYCVTTAAFRRFIELTADLDIGIASAEQPAQLAALRHSIEHATIPEEIATEIRAALDNLGPGPYAVRSSATSEDRAAASSAGLHDSFLNINGASAVLDSIRRCWASLYTDRAVDYRARNSTGPAPEMAVVVQRMVDAQAAGVMFTADPVTSDRRITHIEAVHGLADDLVSGLVSPDIYSVREGAAHQGPRRTDRLIDSDRPVLGDPAVMDLVRLGRRLEQHFGYPLDIEWCLGRDGGLAVVQARPITTLFPVPPSDDAFDHVYLSVGHQQMMTDPMKPLGLSIWQLTTKRPMAEAAGRLFVDVTQALASPAGRQTMIEAFRSSDPRTGDALQAVVDNDDFRWPPVPDGPAWKPPGSGAPAPLETDRAIVTAMIEATEQSIDTAREAIAGLSGIELLDFIEADIGELQRVQFDPRSLQAIAAGQDATAWLNEHLESWLGVKKAADVLTQSVPGNVTAEMGLALLDVADVIRPHPEVVALLRRAEDGGFMAALPEVPGGTAALAAIEDFLDRYGMRCEGEIDITRPRWREEPFILVPMILSHVAHAEPGAGPRRFEQGRQAAAAFEAELVERLRALPDGAAKAAETTGMIERARTFNGYREFPKFGMITRYFVYRQALRREADRLTRAGIVSRPDDIDFLRFDELRDAVRARRADQDLIRQRRAEFADFARLSAPRVLTSYGELINGKPQRGELPDGALVGVAASSGVVEGRARVIRSLADADLTPGDILVTPHTDPSWSPLFATAAGLVTEVGGMMTHGSVIAREYGLPAVVGLDAATRLIRDGQRIRVNGVDGVVELLD